MVERVLGVAAHSPGAAAVLVEDGRPTAAVVEGAFTRKPDEAAFPRRAVRHCLREAGVAIDGIDRLVVAEKPLRKFERILVTHLRGFPSTTRAFSAALFRWLGDRLWAKNGIVAELGIAPERLRFVEHHHALACAAFLASPFEDAAVLTVGRAGEGAAATLQRGEGTTVSPWRELQFPHAPTMLFDAVTRHLGLEPEIDEARVLALAAAGEATGLPVMRQLFASAADGAPTLDPEAVRGPFDDGVRTTEKFDSIASRSTAALKARVVAGVWATAPRPFGSRASIDTQPTPPGPVDVPKGRPWRVMAMTPDVIVCTVSTGLPSRSSTSPSFQVCTRAFSPSRTNPSSSRPEKAPFARRARTRSRTLSSGMS